MVRFSPKIWRHFVKCQQVWHVCAWTSAFIILYYYKYNNSSLKIDSTKQDKKIPTLTLRPSAGNNLNYSSRYWETGWNPVAFWGCYWIWEAKVSLCCREEHSLLLRPAGSDLRSHVLKRIINQVPQRHYFIFFEYLACEHSTYKRNEAVPLIYKYIRNTRFHVSMSIFMYSQYIQH